MHILQKKILNLAETQGIGNLKLREIGDYIGESHRQKVKHHVDQLLKKGLLIRDSLTNEITLASSRVPESNFISIPVVGKANCGEASYIADEQIEGMLRISKSLVDFEYKPSLIAVKAVGTSMNRAKIRGSKKIDDGDYVVIDSDNRVPNNGDYVLSIIDNLANIKKFIHEGENGRIVLVSESYQDLPPIYIDPNDVDSYIVNGKVIDVIKGPYFNQEASSSMPYM